MSLSICSLQLISGVGIFFVVVSGVWKCLDLLQTLLCDEKKASHFAERLFRQYYKL